MLSEKSFDTGELLLNYAEGPASGPPLVLLHGLASWWRTWEPCLPELTPAWHVHAVDLRGHGQSGRVGVDYMLTDYARDIAAFLKGPVSRPAMLMGHSLGALTALATASLVPDRLRALVLIDPPLYLRSASVQNVRGAANWFRWVYELVEPSRSFDEVLERCRLEAPELEPAELKAMANKVYRVAPGTVATALQDRMLGDLELGHIVQQVECPMLLMRGDWSSGSAIRDEDATWFQNLAPRAQVVRIPNGDHDFLWLRPELTFAHIHAFLRAE